MTRNDTRLGIWLMVTTTFIFSMQDGLSRHLAETYNVWMVVMIRYWFFAAFVIAIAAPAGGRRPRRPREARNRCCRPSASALLAPEIMVMVMGFVFLGLVESHAVFACYPLLIAALSGPVLGETMSAGGAGSRPASASSA